MLELFLIELKRAHIFLSDDVNEIVWVYNKEGGSYAAKLEYANLNTLMVLDT